MTLPLLLFIIGMLGFLLNRKNLLLLILSLELILLAVTLIVLMSSYEYNDIVGQIFGVLIISVAAAETAIGLGILVAYYRIRGTISLILN